MARNQLSLMRSGLMRSNLMRSGLMRLDLTRLGLMLGLAGAIACAPMQALLASQVTFQPPREGAPRRTTGGASRGGSECFTSHPQQQAEFTAVTPESEFGLTVSERPTFMAYVPASSAQEIFFSLKDEAGNQVYQTIFTPTNREGIVSFTMPEQLEINKRYQWSMVLLCNDSLRPDSPRSGGWVQRVELNTTLAAQLEHSTPIEQAALYGQAGIWYDMVNTLSALRRSQPQNVDVALTWENLLKENGLSGIAEVPIQ